MSINTCMNIELVALTGMHLCIYMYFLLNNKVEEKNWGGPVPPWPPPVPAPMYSDGLWYKGWLSSFNFETGKWVVMFYDDDETTEVSFPDKEVRLCQ